MIRRFAYFIAVAFFLFAVSCSVSDSEHLRKKTDSGSNSATEKAKPRSTKTVETVESTIRQAENNPGKTYSTESARARVKECLSVDTGDRFVLKTQTFPIDFKPFEQSCFVTAHDPEYKTPPLGSVISIYKNGKQVYKFDSRFNPDAATCWVETVSFEDLTDDGLTDIIVVGKCGVKAGEVQGNEVFINTGEGFYTNVGSNDKLDNFNKIKDIADFVRQNKKLFSE